MSIFITLLILYLGAGVFLAFYKAGKYANGGVDLSFGRKAAVAEVISGLVTLLIMFGLIFGW